MKLFFGRFAQPPLLQDMALEALFSLVSKVPVSPLIDMGEPSNLNAEFFAPLVVAIFALLAFLHAADFMSLMLSAVRLRRLIKSAESI